MTSPPIERLEDGAALQPARESRPISWPLVLVGAAFLIQAGQLLAFTLRNAVNVLFWDQWDFTTPIFRHEPLWRIFAWQHGPIRLGVGGVCTALLAALTRWNTRAEAVAVVVVVAAAALAALRLRRRIGGPLSFTDVAIPLLLLSRLQYEMIVGPTNLSHGPFPLLLAMLLCLAWLVPWPAPRYALVAGLNFLTVFTAFGLLMGLVTPALLALDAWCARRAGNRRALAAALIALALALLTLGVFFVGYRFAPGDDTFHFPYHDVLAYPWYAGLILANTFGLKTPDGIVASMAGIVLLGAVAGVLALHVRRLVRQEAETEPQSRVVAILLAFSLLFVLAAAVGRVQLGGYSADSSRYYPYAVTGILGLYLHARGMRRPSARRWALGVVLAGSLAAGLRLTRFDRDTIFQFSNGKREWRSCYVATRSIAGCDRAAGFAIYPHPEKTGLQAKLDYLERHRLNLFADEPLTR